MKRRLGLICSTLLLSGLNTGGCASEHPAMPQHEWSIYSFRDLDAHGNPTWKYSLEQSRYPSPCQHSDELDLQGLELALQRVVPGEWVGWVKENPRCAMLGGALGQTEPEDLAKLTTLAKRRHFRLFEPNEELPPYITCRVISVQTSSPTRAQVECFNHSEYSLEVGMNSLQWGCRDTDLSKQKKVPLRSLEHWVRVIALPEESTFPNPSTPCEKPSVAIPTLAAWGEIRQVLPSVASDSPPRR